MGVIGENEIGIRMVHAVLHAKDVNVSVLGDDSLIHLRNQHLKWKSGN
jgi:hypothetical protein